MSETLSLPATPDDDAGAEPLRRLPWRYWVLVLLPPLVVLVSAGMLWHFVSFAFLSNPILNSIIAGFMLWGCATMALQVRRVYAEDAVFRSGMRWLRKGVQGTEPDPRWGPPAFVLGMLSRLQKLGLGHQVYIHSSAMEPELSALEQYFEKKQDLSQFLVGVMVALGLLGTFVGLLETLVSTSQLIATISDSVGNAGAGGDGGMEKEFARIVGGLKQPLEAMGTAFSASMFGLVGSIMLGFQMIVVRKTISDFLESVRGQVLSLAEKTKIQTNVEVTEAFLATLLADIALQHKAFVAEVRQSVSELQGASPMFAVVAQSMPRLVEHLAAQSGQIDQVVQGMQVQSQALALLKQVMATSQEALDRALLSADATAQLTAWLPTQQAAMADISAALDRVQALSTQLDGMQRSQSDLLLETRTQGLAINRLDAMLWSAEKDALSKALLKLPEDKS